MTEEDFEQLPILPVEQFMYNIPAPWKPCLDSEDDLQYFHTKDITKLPRTSHSSSDQFALTQQIDREMQNTQSFSGNFDNEKFANLQNSQ